MIWTLLLSVAFAEPEYIESYTKNPIPNEVVEFSVAKEFHFSGTTECGAGGVKGENWGSDAEDETKHFFNCTYPAPGVFEARMNVCENQGTKCHPLTAKVDVQGEPARGLANEKVEFAPLEKPDGFIFATPGQAAQIAKEQNKLLLVVYSTKDCGWCVRAREFLFPLPEFAAATKNWLKVYVDVEASPEHEEWRKIHRAYGVPAFVAFNSDLKPLGLIQGYKGSGHVKNQLEELARLHRDPIADVIARVEQRRQNSKWRKWKDIFVSAASRKTDELRYFDWAYGANKEDLLKSIVQAPAGREGEFLDWKMDQVKYGREWEAKPEEAEKVKRELFEARQRLYGDTPYEKFLKSVAACEFDEKLCHPMLPEAQAAAEWENGQSSNTENEKLLDTAETLNRAGVAAWRRDRKPKDPALSKAIAQVWARIAQIYPNSRMVKIQMQSVALDNVEGEAKVRKLREMAQANLNDPAYVIEIGLNFKRMGNWKEALKTYALIEGRVKNEDWYELQLNKAAALIAAKRVPEAKRTLSRTVASLGKVVPTMGHKSQYVLSIVRILEKRMAGTEKNPPPWL